jgi:hypothetical protein
MHRVLTVLALILLAHSALASPSPTPQREEGVNSVSIPQRPKAQVSRVPDALESTLVGRLYTLTYGGQELCKQVGFEESAQFERVLAGFHQAFPEVMHRLRQSSYFEESKLRFSRWIASPEVESAEELANLCLADYTLLKAYSDNPKDPEVVENMLRIKNILTH